MYPHLNKFRPILLLTGALLALGGCTTQDSINATGASLKRIFAVEPKKPFKPHPVAQAYCYRVQSDTLCYRNPQQGMEVQFVARQPVESVGEAIGASDKVPPSVEEIHRGAADNSFPPAARAYGTAEEAASAYPAQPFGRQASFASTSQSTQLSSNSGSYTSSGSTRASTSSSGPRVLMPNQ